MRIYERLLPTTAAYAVLDEALTRYHGRLAEAGVTVDLLWTEDTNGKPFLVSGYPAIARVRICSLDERVAGRADAEIVLDRGEWMGLEQAEQVAVMDHELTHLVLVYEKMGRVVTGTVKRDDHNRPRLKMRRHDYQVGGFRDIAERHRSHSQEWQQAVAAESLLNSWRQLELAFESAA